MIEKSQKLSRHVKNLSKSFKGLQKLKNLAKSDKFLQNLINAFQIIYIVERIQIIEVIRII